ncbi:DnaJ domain-containing protein [Chloroflexi bacterium TSY]|nr:DnaJ domain-containing protein [Chloroflexi bacterium TSY]
MERTAQRDYYEILGVSRDADEKKIKNAFRELARKYHPDHNKEEGAEERFKEIAEAYGVLSDPDKRALYDTRGFAGVEGFSADDLFGGINFDEIFRGFGFGRENHLGGGSIFDSFFGRRRHAGPTRGADIEVNLEVPLERTLAGGEETVHFARRVTCANCNGSGAEPGTEPRQCTNCHGSGQRVEGRRDKGVLFQQITFCPLCHGRGTIIDEPCATCSGQGEIEQDETLTVTIPPGFEERMALRFPGRGYPSKALDGPTGDVYVTVRSAPDPRFERRGSNLWRMETISAVDATLGTDLEVPTLDEPLLVTIPSGTQPGTVVRLRGQGLPLFGSEQRGDILLAVQVQIPQSISADERQLYEQIKALESA